MSVLSGCHVEGEGAARNYIPEPLRGLFAMLFVEIFGASLTIPVFTYFCIVELGLSSTYVGVVISSFSAAQLLGAPIVGRLSDAHGRRPALLGCFLWTAVCFLVTAGVHSFWELLLVRTLAGLSGGSIPVTQTMVMDTAESEERPRLLGVMGGLVNLAFTVGPGAVVLALFLCGLPRRLIFLAAAGFAMLGCGIGHLVLQETLPEARRRPLCNKGEAVSPDERTCEGVVSETWALCTPGMLCIWAGRFCCSFSFLCLFTTYAFLIRDAFSWGDREFGLILVLSGVLGALIQFLLYPALSRALGKHLVCVVGALLLSLYFILLPLFTLAFPSIRLHVCIQVLFIAGAAITDPGIPDLVGYHAPEDRMGFAQGLTCAFRALAAVLAPLAAGAAYDASPYHVYFLAAATALVGAGSLGCAPLAECGGGAAGKFASAVERGELEQLLRK